MPPKMRVEVAQPLSRLKGNRILADKQLGFLKFYKMKMIESCWKGFAFKSDFQ